MPNLPPSTDFTNSSVTEGGFKTAMTYMREYLASLLGADGVNATALATLGAVFGSLSAKSANYTVIASDRGQIIQCTATLELALTAAATLGSSFSFVVNNTGSGTITINPSGTELIDGQSTKSLSQGQSAVIYCDGTAFYSVGMSAAGGFSNMQVFTSSGTFTVPAGVTKVKVTVVGGGGGGGSGQSYGSGGGGGGGGSAIEIISGLTPASTVSVTVGGAGTAGSGNGGAGGTSSFGAYCSATGGGGGFNCQPSGYGRGGAGGVGSGGQLNITGGGGGAGTYGNSSSYDAAKNSGAGGSSILGGGGAGVTVENLAGRSGGSYGGGGGGGSGYTSTLAGGVGSAGVVIVEY